MKTNAPCFGNRDWLEMSRLKFISFVCIAFLSQSTLADSIVNSVHNLSAKGPGTIKASNEQDACIFCHTPHRANGATPLWNHNLSGVTNYIVYSSARLDSLNVVVPQPNGSSRLCLSCHDGTVALGGVSSGAGQIQMENGVTTMPAASAANLGTDLSSDHPISFVYDTALAARDPEIKDPAHLSNPTVKTDSQSRLQCTSCHDPHNDRFGNFLVMDNTGSALCLVCHQPNSWITSAHSISVAAVPQSITSKISQKPYQPGKIAFAKSSSATTQVLGCENCHETHHAGSRNHLLISDQPEQNCFNCHNGVVTKKDIAPDFQKTSIHPITLNSQTHSPVEDPINPPIRHVTCADCHDAHAANSNPATAPNAPGALAGVSGVTTSGTIIKPLQKEYELCFRCHADSFGRGPATISRQVIESNTRLQFAAGNQSFHPVTSIGKNLTSVPSLIAPLTTSSRMYCTDCHNSDSSPAAGGSGPNGPHGSIYAPILERNLTVIDNQAESPFAYALCYKCHSRDSILSNQSFKFHSTHVVNDQAACTTCHDSHGVANSEHLMNFNTTYVKPSSNGRLEYNSTGYLQGNCSLTCHGKDHQQTPY